VQKRKGVFNVEAWNIEFLTSVCVRRGLSPVVGLVDGWNFLAGGGRWELPWIEDSICLRKVEFICLIPQKGI
jgi:hypothetical protein